MQDKELRKKIYQRLGLELGSLQSESGNDWERAKKQVIEEEKQKEYTVLQENTTVDLGSIGKNEKTFQRVLISTEHTEQDQKISIAQRKDLDNDEVMKLLKTGNKEVYIAIAKQNNLSSECIDKLIESGVYLAKKILIQNNNLSSAQIETLLQYMHHYPDLYAEQIEILQKNL